jgi:hypothetical protein
MLAVITLWLSLATVSFGWHRSQGDGGECNSGIKGKIWVLSKRRTHLNTRKSLGIWSWVTTGPETKNNCAGDGQQQITSPHLTPLQPSLPFVELISVVPVKIFLHHPSQPHRIWLVLQVFPFAIYRLGKMWRSLKSDERRSTWERHARRLQHTAEDILVSDLPQYPVNLVMCNISFHPLKFLCFLLYSFPGLYRRMMQWGPLLMPYLTNNAHK